MPGINCMLPVIDLLWQGSFLWLLPPLTEDIIVRWCEDSPSTWPQTHSTNIQTKQAIQGLEINKSLSLSLGNQLNNTIFPKLWSFRLSHMTYEAEVFFIVIFLILFVSVHALWAVCQKWIKVGSLGLSIMEYGNSMSVTCDLSLTELGWYKCLYSTWVRIWWLSQGHATVRRWQPH